MTPQKALDKAKIGLMSKADSAFFATLVFGLRFHWRDDIWSAGTDGLNMFINPSFFLNLDESERMFLLVHEAMHPALMHLTRKGNRDHDRWNAAGDYVINQMLHERGFKVITRSVKVEGWPDFPGGLLDAQYAGMTTEQVYDLLPDSQPNPMPDLMEGEGQGNGENQQGNAGMSQEELEARINENLIRARMQSQMAGDKPGTIPGMIQIYLDNLLQPKLPWQHLLRRWLSSAIKEDYSYKRPNRRFLPDYYLPTLYNEGMGELAVAVDTSGSVSDLEFKRFVSEVYQILSRMKPSKLTLIQFDSCIKAVDSVRTPEDLLRLTFTGRGGTCIEPVLEWADEHKPQVLLVFSDGEFYHREEKTKSPVLWLIHNNNRFTAPYGKVVHYQTEVGR